MVNGTHVYVNRTLNLRKIKWLGLDMDHTLVRYHSQAFEELSHRVMLRKLVEQEGYPSSILKLPFDYDLAVRGLVVDCKRGNLLKLSRHGAIRASHHGTKSIDFGVQQKMYKSTYIDLGESERYTAIDTTFSISLATLFAQLVDVKDSPEGGSLPDYETIFKNIMEVHDQAHRDGSVKDEVARHLDRYIIREEAVVRGLERFKKHDKHIFIVTNSDFAYSKLLLDYAINPFLKNHSSWLELFDYVITLAGKPRFFYDDLRFLSVDPQNGTMTNNEGKIRPGVFQGGGANQFAREIGAGGDEILYIGDHIYGDILRLKKDCNWRTALVIDELEREIEGYRKAEPYSEEIRHLMMAKEPLEREQVELVSSKVETGDDSVEPRIAELQGKVSELDKKISHLIRTQQGYFNPRWGEIMRAGNEESYFAHQVDRFACVYMTKLSNLLDLSPRTYFRAARRPLAHELAVQAEIEAELGG